MQGWEWMGVDSKKDVFDDLTANPKEEGQRRTLLWTTSHLSTTAGKTGGCQLKDNQEREDCLLPSAPAVM